MVNVVFLHPDLGIGGAERAVIDAALALKSRGHTVQFVTSHHDPNHCFQETKDGSLEVTVVGDWLPRSFCGRFKAFCAYLRMIYAAIYLIFFSAFTFDLVFCDQISACIPVLKYGPAQVLFYCHFPDLLLTSGRDFWLKRIYRAPIDWFEEWTTGMADTILVNSNFTAGVFRDTFKSLSHIEPEVVYPIPDFNVLSQPLDEDVDLIPPNQKAVFLSINRYERKKNLPLAIRALDHLIKKLGSSEGIHLIMAGGYDPLVVENREHYTALKNLAEDLGLEKNVTFLRSCSDAHKRSLISNSTALLYTPDREHFGIVPIEAMYLRCPVIAVNSGGPLETVKDGVTGFHCVPKPDDFANAMMKFMEDDTLKKNFGEAGHIRVVSKFSFAAFTNQLDQIVTKMTS